MFSCCWLAENADAMEPSSIENAAVFHAGQPSDVNRCGKQNAYAKTATVSSMNVTAVAESAGLLAEIAGLLAEKNADLPLLLQQKKTQNLAYAS